MGETDYKVKPNAYTLVRVSIWGVGYNDAVNFYCQLLNLVN